MKAIPTDMQLYERIKQKVKKDAKSRWPSAYLSGQVVRDYKKAMEKKGLRPYRSIKSQTPLKRWYNEKWVDIKTGKPCGSVKTSKYYPTCRPSKKITSKTPILISEISEHKKKQMITQKQKAKEKTVHYKY